MRDIENNELNAMQALQYMQIKFEKPQNYFQHTWIDLLGS